MKAEQLESRIKGMVSGGSSSSSGKERLLLRLGVHRIVFVVILVFLFSGFWVPSAGTAEKESPAESALSGQALESGGVGSQFMAVLSGRLEEVTESLSETGQALLEIPGLMGEVFFMAKDPRNLIQWGETALKVVLVLLVGLLAGWVVRRLLNRARRFVVDREGDVVLIRILFLFFRTLLDIIPIAGFALAAYAVLALADPTPVGRVIALTLVSAAFVTGVILTVARMICIPGVRARSFLFVDEETGQYAYIWVRRLVLLGVYGYFILEAALLTGVPEVLYSCLMKFLTFFIMLLLVTLILQNKKDVAARLRGESSQRPKNEGKFPAMGAFLRRLADGWYLAAIFVVVGFYIVWMLELEGGTTFLASGIVMTLVVIFVAGVLARLVRQGVERLFYVREELKAAYPDLERRANRYQPFVRSALSGIIYVIATFAILEAWGLGTLGWLFSPTGGIVVTNMTFIIIIIVVSLLIWEIVNILIDRSITRAAAAEDGSKRMLTLMPMLRNVVLVSLVVIAAMLVLSHLGINIGPLLAGAGVVGLAVGFGAQTLVRDMITGAFILVEDAIAVGDWVDLGGRSGTVEHLTLRTVTLRDLGGTVHVIPFSEVSTVTNYNRDYGYAVIDAGVAYRERYGDVVQALQDVAIELQQDDIWGPFITGDLEVFGMNKLADSAVEIRVRLKTLPMKQFAVRRAFLERMKRVFDERDIEIPFPHQTVWFGTGKDGTAPPMRLSMDHPEPDETPRASDRPSSPRIPVVSESEASRDVVEEMEASEEQKER